MTNRREVTKGLLFSITALFLPKGISPAQAAFSETTSENYKMDYVPSGAVSDKFRRLFFKDLRRFEKEGKTKETKPECVMPFKKRKKPARVPHDIIKTINTLMSKENFNGAGQEAKKYIRSNNFKQVTAPLDRLDIIDTLTDALENEDGEYDAESLRFLREFQNSFKLSTASIRALETRPAQKIADQIKTPFLNALREMKRLERKPNRTKKEMTTHYYNIQKLFLDGQDSIINAFRHNGSKPLMVLDKLPHDLREDTAGVSISSDEITPGEFKDYVEKEMGGHFIFLVYDSTSPSEFLEMLATLIEEQIHDIHQSWVRDFENDKIAETDPRYMAAYAMQLNSRIYSTGAYDERCPEESQYQATEDYKSQTVEYFAKEIVRSVLHTIKKDLPVSKEYETPSP